MVLRYSVDAGALKVLTRVVVLAGKVRTCVEVYVLGAIVRVSVDVNGIVIRSVYVWTLARFV